MVTTKKKTAKKPQDNTPKEILKCPNCDFQAEKDTRKFKDGFYKCMHFKNQNIQYERWGVYPLCKGCIREICYDKSGNFLKDKFVQMLKDYFNRPLLEDKFNDVVSSGREIIGEYFKIIGLKGFSDMTWEDGEKIKVSKETINKKASYSASSNTDLEDIEVDKLSDKWGFGYNNEELIAFEKKYQQLKNNYSEKTAMHTEALLTYIRYRVKEEIATAKGDVKEAKDWAEMANKAATNAKINPSQLSKADLSDGLSTFSELSQAVEKEVDIIPILPRFKYRPNDALDFNIWCYVNYERDLAGMPPCKYEDVYKFYDIRKQDYVQQYGDPYGIFTDDTSEGNRGNIKKFIEEETQEGDT